MDIQFKSILKKGFLPVVTQCNFLGEKLMMAVNYLCIRVDSIAKDKEFLNALIEYIALQICLNARERIVKINK